MGIIKITGQTALCEGEISVVPPKRFLEELSELCLTVRDDIDLI